jgi:ribonuclease PH
VSVGVVEGEACLDLCYAEDSTAEMDMNLVMCEDGRIVEIQCSAERRAFSRQTLDQLLELGEHGVRQLIVLQKAALNGP